MNAYYDPEVDALYLEMGPGTPDGVVEVASGVNFDTTSANEVVGIEILDASRKLDVQSFLSAVAQTGARCQQ